VIFPLTANEQDAGVATVTVVATRSSTCRGVAIADGDEIEVPKATADRMLDRGLVRKMKRKTKTTKE